MRVERTAPDEMPAGREMDTLVVEKVMKWPVHRAKWNGHTWIVGPIIDEAVYVCVWPDKVVLHRQNGKGTRWHPSVDITAAWEVDRSEWLWTFDEFPDTLQVRIWHRDASRLFSVTDVGWGEAETKAEVYALARCRAALEAVAAE